MPSLTPKAGVLGKRLAAHLLRRATFGPTRAEIELFSELTAEEALNRLLIFPPIPGPPKDPQTQLPWVPQGRGQDNSSNDDLKYVVGSWWLHQVFRAQEPTLFHKLFFFLHTSFVTSLRDIAWSENHYFTLQLLMRYVNGSYRELAVKMCLDNGMNNFLDIGDSDKENPNENFVREFFELFTIGKGPSAGEDDYTRFTEQDVQEAARLMTGFQINNDWADPQYWDPQTGLPRCTFDLGRHDSTDKVFSHRFGERVIAGQATEAGMIGEVEEFVDMIFDQEMTAIHICRRLYRFFVQANIPEGVDQDIIYPLAETFRSSDYQLRPVIEQLLKSEHFFESELGIPEKNIVGALIKSPLELSAGMIRYFGVPLPEPDADLFLSYIDFYASGVQEMLSEACMDLFAPDEVAGYQPVYQGPEYQRLWMSAKSIPARYAMIDEHLDGPEILRIAVMDFIQNPQQIADFDGIDPIGTPGPHPGARVPRHLVNELVTHLLPEVLAEARFDYFLNEVLLDNLDEKNWVYEWIAYQDSGDETNIEPQIRKLIRAILQSPEYQLG